MHDLAVWLFEWLAETYQSEHWKLSAEQADRIARPATKLANAVWIKLQERLPDKIATWLESTPGAMGLLIAGGFIVVPRVKKQLQLSRERKYGPPVAQGGRVVEMSGASAQPKPSKGTGMIWGEGKVE